MESTVPRKAVKFNYSLTRQRTGKLGRKPLPEPMLTLTMTIELTHLPLDKMAVILENDIFDCIFLNENDRIPIHISLKYVPRSPIDNKPELVHVMAWRRAGDKPLPGPVMT